MNNPDSRGRYPLPRNVPRNQSFPRPSQYRPHEQPPLRSITPRAPVLPAGFAPNDTFRDPSQSVERRTFSDQQFRPCYAVPLPNDLQSPLPLQEPPENSSNFEDRRRDHIFTEDVEAVKSLRHPFGHEKQQKNQVLIIFWEEKNCFDKFLKMIVILLIDLGEIQIFIF